MGDMVQCSFSESDAKLNNDLTPIDQDYSISTEANSTKSSKSSPETDIVKVRVKILANKNERFPREI